MSSIYAALWSALNDSQGVILETTLSQGAGRILSRQVLPLEPGKAAAVTAVREGDTLTVREPVLPQERLIILGGGHIAAPLCAFGAQCGFQTYVVDDRPDFANGQRFPLAAQVICREFADALDSLHITGWDYVVIVTRGHRHDADCLRRVLSGTAPAYLGMIGSRRRVSAQMELLKQEGFPQERLDRVCTPIGLPIGGVTPSEIAVSILAEVIAHKRLPQYAAARPLSGETDLEVSVLAYLARDPGPKALVTILEARGSSPRGAGAKMAVRPDGTITGTIGGGYSEAAAIRAAVSLIGTGGCRIMEFDMSGQVAENDGMVCGGTVTVLIEDVGGQ